MCWSLGKTNIYCIIHIKQNLSMQFFLDFELVQVCLFGNDEGSIIESSNVILVNGSWLSSVPQDDCITNLIICTVYYMLVDLVVLQASRPIITSYVLYACMCV